MPGSPSGPRVDGPARSGLRERKKASRRLVIRSAALELFVEQGFSNTTVEQIATRAGIAPRTFFNYFSTKEECVVFLHDELGDEFHRIAGARPPQEDALSLIRETCKSIFGARDHLPTVRTQIIQSLLLQRNEPSLRAADGAYRKVWEDAAYGALIARRVDPLRARIVAVAGIGTTKIALMEWASDGAHRPISDAIHEAFDELALAVRGHVPNSDAGRVDDHGSA